MDGMSQREFQNYLGLLGRLLRLRTTQRKAIEEELRAHMEERFAALTSQGIGPEQAVSLALAEFGDAAALAAEFTAISRLQKRRWMMRFTIGSIAATILLSAVVVSLWPDGSGKLADTLAQAQQVEKPAPPRAEQPTAPKAEESAPKQDANARTQAKLEAHTDAEFQEIPLKDMLGHLAAAAKVQVYVDRLPLDDQGIDAATAPITINLKDVPAEMVLRLVLRQHGLAYMLDHGVVIVTTPEVVQNDLEIEVYSIGDLVQPGGQPVALTAVAGGQSVAPSFPPGAGEIAAAIAARPDATELMDLITSTVDPTSWEQVGGPARMREYRRTLVIAQTYQGHRKVKTLLEGLRQAIEK
jgi:hypothetical protein